MTTGRFWRQLVLTAAILVAPFIAWLYRAEAGLGVMSLVLSAGSYLLADALGATPERVRRWLRLGIGINVALATVCLGLAVWLLLR